MVISIFISNKSGSHKIIDEPKGKEKYSERYKSAFFVEKSKDLKRK